MAKNSPSAVAAARARRRRLEPPRHGSAYIYQEYACRCDACREAMSEYQRQRRDERRREFRSSGQLPDGVEHGSYAAFREIQCSCGRCRKASGDYFAAAHVQNLRREVVTHGHNGYVRGCRCEECRGGHREMARRTSRIERPPTRNRYEWTGPELELASRPDLSARRVAEMTGRTPAAVGNMRKRLKAEPKLQRLAGTSEDVDA